MRIGVIGINHKSAGLALREKLAKATMRPFGGTIFHPALSYVLLSTCNRTEVYFCARDLAECHTYCLSLLRESIEEEFEHSIYAYFGSDCFEHLVRVTAGLDSAAYGETEIQGQVKCAYELAAKSRYLSAEMHYLFQKSLKIAKEIRSNAPSYSSPSLETVILRFSSEILGNLQSKKILFVGLSEINQRIYSRLKGKGPVTFCTRSQEKLHRFAAKENIEMLPWENLAGWQLFDLIIFGTKASDYLIREEGLSFKHGAPKLLIDLSVPRNVDPELSKINSIHLFNIDELQRASNPSPILRDESPPLKQAVFRQIALFHAKRSKPFQFFNSFINK